jgi:hypothetical protein
MRLWTLHPKYLDSTGLVAVWREALLAQAVLLGRTKGYRHHPQLMRFKAQANSAAAIGAYLRGVHIESQARGYRFDESKIGPQDSHPTIEVSEGQLEFEWRHLMAKLSQRAPQVYQANLGVSTPEAHPLFAVVAGPIAEWERASET